MDQRKKQQQEKNRRAWETWLNRLDETKSQARQMGGAEKVAKVMHGRGKLDARQRVEALFDPNSFVELGTLVGNKDNIPADGFVCGMGKIDGRPVLAGVEDYTIHAGSCGTGGGYKRHRLAELAVQEGLPLVWMLEGAGARMEVRKSTPARTPVDLAAMADAKGQVPVVCLILGVSAGHGALTAPFSDFVVMTQDAAMFTGGPPLVKAATGEDVTREELGGPQVCVHTAGSVHNLVADDVQAISLARQYLGFFPSNRSLEAPRRHCTDTGFRQVGRLLDIIPPDAREPYDVRDVIKELADENRVLEVQPDYGKSLVTALVHLGGRAVAIVANNPAFRAGALEAAGAIKGMDFIENADVYGLPVIYLLDNPGVMAGTRSEREGVLKWGGKMYLASRRQTSPKISVLMRKGFGFGLVTMAHMPHDNQTLTLALPSANIATMPAQSGGQSAKIDDETREKIAQAQRGGPYGLADRLGIDEVIDPREVRNALINGLEMTSMRPRPGGRI